MDYGSSSTWSSSTLIPSLKNLSMDSEQPSPCFSPMTCCHAPTDIFTYRLGTHPGFCLCILTTVALCLGSWFHAVCTYNQTLNVCWYLSREIPGRENVECGEWTRFCILYSLTGIYIYIYTYPHDTFKCWNYDKNLFCPSCVHARFSIRNS